MKKIININFHSRVIPIEETAYDILRKYVESLKNHFAREEGADEIVNDIENRFAELFSDRLKKGATCITDADVNEIITSMGRPEDFDQDEKNTSTNDNAGSRTSSAFAEEATASEPRRLYRSENDKMLGGVCGGIAAYLKIDSSVVRIIFTLLTLGFGTGILVYLILWVVLPPKSMVTNIRKRLFRDSDHRVIGGVASGLAAYFNIDIWIPRVIFCLPLIFGIIRSIFSHIWFDFDSSFSFIANGFGGGLTTIYIILWIVLPEARTASEKLEMRGEKIDLESIKNTIKSDLEGIKQKASNVGAEMKQRAEEFGSEMKYRSTGIKKDISSVNIPRQGIGHAIGVLFKAFFLFVTVIITFALIAALIGVIFSGGIILPLKEYIFHGFWQNIMVWTVLLLFFVLPVVGLLTWLIRRIIGARSGNNYLGYTFGSLWVIGLICFIFLIATISRHFSTRSGVNDDFQITTPSNGRLIVQVDDSKPFFIDSDWMGVNWRHKGPFFNLNEDSLTLNTVRVDIVKSKDSSWHLRRERLSRGNSSTEARELASQIDFPIEQNDSLLTLARGFAITPKQQFRNQQVLVVIEMPVGKRILLKSNVDDYKWFNINNRSWRNNGINIDWNDSENDYPNSWDTEVEYIMTESGLERTNKNYKDSYNNEEQKKKSEQDSNHKKKDSSNDYRYHKPKTANSAATKVADPSGTNENKVPESIATIALLTSMS
ncbi:MAG TPA: PspC domain-containing protein [Puia sp.]|jgi:phage shock protein PspC (stress-responsive transcriptional regulator)|nr:PspC domain-containing protein [Puia sp.]